jgi:hypothetical protein
MEQDPSRGLGFVVTEGDAYVGIDLDHCLDPETGAFTDPIARGIVERLASYTEITPSRSGVRVWIKAKMPPGRRRKGNIEVYESGRYFTMTGVIFECDLTLPTTIEWRQAELEWLCQTYLGIQPAKRTSLQRLAIPDRTSPVVRLADMTVEELEAFLDSDPRIRQTWEHKRREASSDGSDSGYEMSLANFAAHYGWDASKIFCLLQKHRSKYSAKDKGDDYYYRTIQKAMANFNEHAEQQRLRERVIDISQTLNQHSLQGRINASAVDRLNALNNLSALLGIEFLAVFKERTDEEPEYQLKFAHGTFVVGRVDTLVNERLFRNAIADITGKLLPAFGKKQWPIVAQLLLIACEEVDNGPSATRGGQTRSWLTQYLSEFPLLDNKDEALSTQYPCRVDGQTHIFGAHFLQWLFQYHGVKMSEKAMGKYLRAAGAIPHAIRFEKEPQVYTTRHLWRISDEEEHIS